MTSEGRSVESGAGWVVRRSYQSLSAVFEGFLYPLHWILLLNLMLDVCRKFELFLLQQLEHFFNWRIASSKSHSGGFPSKTLFPVLQMQSYNPAGVLCQVLDRIIPSGNEVPYVRDSHR